MRPDIPCSDSHYFDIALLDQLQTILEADISNYELREHEDLYDENNDRIIRSFTFNRGIKDYTLILSSDGTMKWVGTRTPKDLIVGIANSIIILLNEIIESRGSIRG
jgi:hypothetical protein